MAVIPERKSEKSLLIRLDSGLYESIRKLSFYGRISKKKIVSEALKAWDVSGRADRAKAGSETEPGAWEEPER